MNNFLKPLMSQKGPRKVGLLSASCSRILQFFFVPLNVLLFFSQVRTWCLLFLSSLACITLFCWPFVGSLCLCSCYAGSTCVCTGPRSATLLGRDVTVWATTRRKSSSLSALPPLRPTTTTQLGARRGCIGDAPVTPVFLPSSFVRKAERSRLPLSSSLPLLRLGCRIMFLKYVKQVDGREKFLILTRL